MKRLLVVFAHPDDEAAIAGTLAHYSKNGVRIALACATRGESGEISDPELASSENLGTVREQELRCAADVIGVNDLHLLGYCDSGMEGSPDNNRPTAFIQANPDDVRFKLVKLIRHFKPHIVVTFEPHGWYGHPDHIAAGKFTTEAYELANRADAFPKAGEVWQPHRLYHALLDFKQFSIIFDFARKEGWDTSNFDTISSEMALMELPPVSHRLEVDAYFEIREQATRCHRTQFGEDNLMLKVPEEVRRQAGRFENFSQIFPVPGGESSPEKDLFNDIDAAALN